MCFYYTIIFITIIKIRFIDLILRILLLDIQPIFTFDRHIISLNTILHLLMLKHRQFLQSTEKLLLSVIFLALILPTFFLQLSLHFL